MVKYIPEWGDIISLNFSPHAGVEQGGRRPALVVSNKIFNRTGLVLVCPITRQIKGFRYEIPLPEDCEVQGVILSNHIASRDSQNRQAKFICKAPVDVSKKTIQFMQAFMSDSK